MKAHSEEREGNSTVKPILSQPFGLATATYLYSPILTRVTDVSIVFDKPPTKLAKLVSVHSLSVPNNPGVSDSSKAARPVREPANSALVYVPTVYVPRGSKYSFPGEEHTKLGILSDSPPNQI